MYHPFFDWAGAAANLTGSSAALFDSLPGLITPVLPCMLLCNREQEAAAAVAAALLRALSGTPRCLGRRIEDRPWTKYLDKGPPEPAMMAAKP